MLWARRRAVWALPGRPASTLVIVESPTKARMLKQWLDPASYAVESCEGHVRDLPTSAAQVPAELKAADPQWARFGFNPADFKPHYLPLPGKARVIGRLRAALRCEQLREVVLATDADREGEAIAWHLAELLLLPATQLQLSRAVFHEVSESAVKRALQQRRCGDAAQLERVLDMNLVRAQEARRLLDRLTGFTLTPVVWRCIGFGLSAGRVQSPALRLLAQREALRRNFVPAQLHSLDARLLCDSGVAVAARLVSVAGRPLLTAADVDNNTGQPPPGREQQYARFADAAQLQQLLTQLHSGRWRVADVSASVHSRAAPLPYITSSLQQDAAQKLGMRASHTMRVAQALYEQGLITYMRTDLPALSADAAAAARRLAGSKCRPLDADRQQDNDQRRQHLHAQEAHEAIRPTIDPRTGLFRRPDALPAADKKPDGQQQQQQQRLYQLIYNRTVASTMIDAQQRSMTVSVEGPGDTLWKAHYRLTVEASFLPLIDADAVQTDSAPFEQLLGAAAPPALTLSGDVAVTARNTTPPNRMSEGRLLRELERHGIGRPSTYAHTIDRLLATHSAALASSGSLMPTLNGLAVCRLLERHFEPLVDVGFTRELELALDRIAVGQLDAAAYLRHFYTDVLQPRLVAAAEHATPAESRLIGPADLSTDSHRHLQHIGARLLAGQYSAYLQFAAHRVPVPSHVAADELTPAFIDALVARHADAAKLGRKESQPKKAPGRKSTSKQRESVETSSKAQTDTSKQVETSKKQVETSSKTSKKQIETSKMQVETSKKQIETSKMQVETSKKTSKKQTKPSKKVESNKMQAEPSKKKTSNKQVERKKPAESQE